MTTPQAPEIFQLPLDALNRNDLPARDDPGFDEALITRYALEYAAKGWSAAVVVSDGFLRVVAVPQQGIEPKAYLLGLLQHGYIEDALPGLEAMFGMVDDPDIAFNYGVALSELDRVQESLAPLNKCLNLDPSYDNAAIALGVSLAKLERYEEAEIVLKAATKIQPDNALVKQNLAATLARAGKPQEALPYFRQAVSLAPNTPSALMGLAQCLDSIEEHRPEALKVDLLKQHFGQMKAWMMAEFLHEYRTKGRDHVETAISRGTMYRYIREFKELGIDVPRDTSRAPAKHLSELE